MSPPNAEALLQNAGWIRALCRSLVRDPHRAEDAVQETFVRALESGPREPRAMRQWLRTVARNAVFQRGRQESARRKREERVSRQVTEVPSPEEALQKAAMRRRIVEAVLDLDEPYRTTVVLRFFEELSTEEVARARGITPSTVRSQCQRAMRRLRHKLQAEFDEEEAGMPLGALLLAMSREPAAPITPAPHPAAPEGTGGSGALGGSAGLSAGAIALVQAAGLTAITLGGVWWLLGDGSSVEAGRTPWGRRHPLTVVERPGPQPGAFLGRATPPEDRPERLTSLLVLDAATEAALEGVRVELTFHERGPSGRLIPRHLGLGASGHGGQLVLRLPEDARNIAAAQTSCLLTQAGYLPRRVTPEELFDLPEGATLQVGMLSEGTLEVALVDADENPLPSLAIRARPRIDAVFGSSDDFVRETHLDSVGQASITGLPSGVPIDLELSADGGADGYGLLRRTVRIDPLSRHTRTVLTAPRTTLLEGTLVDPGGAPLRGVAISLTEPPLPGTGAPPARIALTDEIGHFQFEHARLGTASVSIGRDAGSLRIELQSEDPVDLGRITGPELVRLSGELLLPTEAPPRDPVVHAFRAGKRLASAHAGPEGHFEFDLPPGDLRLLVTDGRFEDHHVLANLAAAAPSSGLSVQLVSPGKASEVTGNADAHALPPTLSALTVDEVGAPIPNALVTLVVLNQGHETRLRFLTDSDGRVELPLSGAGGLPLRVEAERLDLGIANAFEFAAGTPPPQDRPLRLTLHPFAAVRLRLEGKSPPDPAETARLEVGASSRLVVPGSVGSLGIAGGERVRVLRHLAPGPVSLRWRDATYGVDLAAGEERGLTLPTDPPDLEIELAQDENAPAAFTCATLLPLGDPSAPAVEAGYLGPGHLLCRRVQGPALLLLRSTPGALPLAVEVSIPEKGKLRVEIPTVSLPIDRPESGPDLRVSLLSLAARPLNHPLELRTERDADFVQRIPAAPPGATLRLEGLDGTHWVSREVIVPEDPSEGIHWP